MSIGLVMQSFLSLGVNQSFLSKSFLNFIVDAESVLSIFCILSVITPLKYNIQAESGCYYDVVLL